jgi:hypothetical protein
MISLKTLLTGGIRTRIFCSSGGFDDHARAAREKPVCRENVYKPKISIPLKCFENVCHEAFKFPESGFQCDIEHDRAVQRENGCHSKQGDQIGRFLPVGSSFTSGRFFKYF